MASEIITKRLNIGGMTCIGCQNKIQKKLQNTVGIKKVTVSYTAGTAEITYDGSVISLKDIKKVIEKLDYTVLPDSTGKGVDITHTISILVLIIWLYMMLQRFGILNRLAPSQLADTNMGYGMLFVIGLITSVHCIAMCGGINLSQSIPRKAVAGNSRFSAFLPTFLYNLGRVISYTFIGFLLGFVGMVLGGDSQTGLSTMLQGILKIIAGAVMVIMGINMLGLFPRLRKLTPRMPKFLAAKLAGKRGNSRQPLIVGLLNGLMPCGPLQSMQIVALASGNPFTGALAMFFFSLGTVPLMLGLGSMVAALGKKFTKTVMNVGAVLVVVLGLAMLSQGSSLSGFGVTIGNGTATASADSATTTEEGVQVVESTLFAGRYPNITVQAGIPVKWIIDAPEGSITGCNYKMLAKDFDIAYTFQTGENIIEFTPKEAGTYQYSCWMGMIRGNIFVVDEDEISAGGAIGSTTDGTETVAGIDISVPVSAGYVIPSEKLAIAEKTTDENGNEIQTVTIELTDEGFSPAVIVVEPNQTVLWKIINNLSTAKEGVELLAPYYSTKLSLVQGENTLSLYPDESFEVSTGDYAFYAYVKVVEDLDHIDETAIREEVNQFETMIYPETIFGVSGSSSGSCCD